MCLAAVALHYISNPIATAFCIILYRSSRPSLCVFRMLCGVCRHVVSAIIRVVSLVISVAASDFIHVFAIVMRPSKSIFRPCATNCISKKRLLFVLLHCSDSRLACILSERRNFRELHKNTYPIVGYLAVHLRAVLVYCYLYKIGSGTYTYISIMCTFTTSHIWTA